MITPASEQPSWARWASPVTRRGLGSWGGPALSVWVILTGCHHGNAPASGTKRNAPVATVEVAAPSPDDAEPPLSQPTVSECNALVAVVNAGVDAVTDHPESDSAIDDLRALATKLDAVKREVHDVELSNSELLSHAEAYEAMVGEIAAAARDLALAVEEVDMDRMSAAQERIDAATAREDPLVAAINETCEQAR